MRKCQALWDAVANIFQGTKNGPTPRELEPSAGVAAGGSGLESGGGGGGVS